MPWIKRVDPPTPPHACYIPDPNTLKEGAFGPGSIWECESCHSRYLYNPITPTTPMSELVVPGDWQDVTQVKL